MATIASSAAGRSASRLVGVRVPVWAAVVFSRLVVLAGGSAGALLGAPVIGWQKFDPHRLTLSLGRVGNVLAASSDRWDAIHYVGIAQHGYTTASSTVFFPLYPLLIRIVTWVTGSYVLSGMLISTAAFAVALALLYRLAQEELGERAGTATVLLLTFAPLSFFFTAVYTESLFLALSVGTFYLARHGRFALACVAAAACSLTHVEGVLLSVPLALIYAQTRPQPFLSRNLVSWKAAPLFFPPLALLGFLVYLHAQGYGWLAPSSNESYYDVQFTGPVITLIRAVGASAAGFWQMLHGAGPLQSWIGSPVGVDFQNSLYLVVLAICFFALVGAWHRLPKVYAIYSALMLIVCTSGAVKGDPLHSFGRFALVLFPLWMIAAAWLSERRAVRLVVEAEAALLLFYAIEFSRWVFIA
jgi:hypothetical protein